MCKSPQSSLNGLACLFVACIAVAAEDNYALPVQSRNHPGTGAFRGKGYQCAPFAQRGEQLKRSFIDLIEPARMMDTPPVRIQIWTFKVDSQDT